MTTEQEVNTSPSPSDWAMDKWREAMERGDAEASRNYQAMYTMWYRREQEKQPNVSN